MGKIKLLPWVVGMIFSIVFTSSGWGLQSGLVIQEGKMLKDKNGSPIMQFDIIISAVPLIPIEINYSTSDGTAKSGKDYTKTNGKAVIPVRQDKATVSVPIIPSASKTNKTFNMTISSSTAVFNPTATGTILAGESILSDTQSSNKLKNQKKDQK